jgi:hypothetical protein
MKTKITIIGLCLIFVLQSCSVNLAKRYSNHFNSIYKPAKTPQTFAQVDIGSKNINETQQTIPVYNVLSLSPEGQAQFIKSLESKFPDSKSFIAQVNTNFNFSKDAKSMVKIIPKTIRKEITFTTNRLQYQQQSNGSVIFNLAGDRIAYLELILRLKDSDKLIFNSWDKYDTKYVTLNLGKASSSQQFNASVTASAKATAEASLGENKVGEDLGSQRELVVVNTGSAPNTTQNTGEMINSLKQTGTSTTGAKFGTELGASATAGYTDKFETAQDLTSRIVDLSGYLSKKQLLLRQEGGIGIDLSGNIRVSLEYTLTDDWAKPVQFVKFKELYSKDGIPVALEELKYSMMTVVFPDIKEDIKGEFDYSFLYRQVNHRNRHVPEARHKVTFWYGTVKASENELLKAKPELLVEKNDVRPKSYSLYCNDAPVLFDKFSPLFESVSEAAGFLHYVTEVTNSGKAVRKLTVNGKTITTGHVENILIKTAIQ